jgi:Tol biopolymer transport system component
MRLRAIPQGYGFLWWRYEVNGHEIWNASGNGGQELFIIRDLDLLLVLTHYSVNGIGHQGVSGLRILERYFLDDEVPESDPRCPATDFAAFTIHPDGTGRAQVSSWPAGVLATSWSIDGSRLAVQSEDIDLNSEIYSVGIDGKDFRRITTDFAFDGLPAWSPDGGALAFARGEPAESDLYRVNATGTGLSQLTDYEGFEHSPTWAPDGERIAFVWGQGDVRGFGADGELWMIGADGAGPERLLDQRIGYPAWSPDGTRIALELRESSHIAVLDLATGALLDLGPGYVPKWSPDGRRLAFVADGNDSLDLFVADSDGSNRVQLTNDADFDTFPLWSPDGDLILFLSRGPGPSP